MNGADASAAAGLNTTKANWNYTGPALPTALANELLAQGKNGPTEIHMAVTGCAAEPTFSQQINATQYVQATSQAVAKYDGSRGRRGRGLCAGVPDRLPRGVLREPEHRGGQRGRQADAEPGPCRRPGLRPALPSGEEVLAAAFYLLPSTVHKPPMPFGALVQWHQRTAVCGSESGSASTLAHHGNAALWSGHGPEGDAVHDDGVAGAGGRRADRHSASRHSDCGGGRDADRLMCSARSDDVHLGQEGG